MKFERLDIHKDLLKGIKEAGFERCTPVQEQSLPETLTGKDIIVQSQTGTGKTAVYLFTILNKLINEGKEPKKPKALIMVPTRELAMQVDEEAKNFGRYLPYRSLAVYGGVGYEKQETELRKGVDIIAATPGRMIDLFKSKTLSLSSINHFVIDEADRMFDMGFTPDICYIASHLPKNRPRQTMLFSATIDNRVIRLASKYMKSNPEMVEIEPEQVTVDSISQKIVYVSNEEKLPALMALLRRPEFERVIIFTNMKITAERIGWKLTGNGFPVKVLTGDKTQASRQRIMERMKAGKVKVLVATEVAARGLHIDDVTHVINYDLPDDAAHYVHRIGRTARAGKTGIAYSLVCEDHALNLPKIEEFIECKIEKEWIDESEMVEDKAGYYRKESQKGYKKSLSRSPGKPKGKAGFSSTAARGEKTRLRKKENGFKKKHTSPAKRKKLPSTSEDRIAYYKEKYGEDFSPAKAASKTVRKNSADSGKSIIRNKPAKPKRKGGVLKKVLKVFGK